MKKKKKKGENTVMYPKDIIVLIVHQLKKSDQKKRKRLCMTMNSVPSKFFFFLNLDKTILYITYVLHIINHKS